MTAVFRRYPAAPAGDHLAVTAPAAVAWLTGQSSFRHSRLSPSQHDLLAAVAGIGYQPVSGGFPYAVAALSAPYRREPLVPASARNAVQYLAARHSPTFGREVAGRLQPLLDRTDEALVLLCGSSGMQLLAAARPWVHVPARLRILVVGLGPVGAAVGASEADGDRLRVHVVQGRGDVVSRLGYRGPVHTYVGCGHLGYTADPPVRATVLRLAEEHRR